MNTDVLVPIGLFLVLLFAFRALLHHAHLSRVQVHQSLRSALEQGAAIEPEVLVRLAQAADPRRADLRQAVVMSAVALALLLLALLLPFSEPSARQAFAALAVIPSVLGLTHFLIWRFWYRSE